MHLTYCNLQSLEMDYNVMKTNENPNLVKLAVESVDNPEQLGNESKEDNFKP